MTLTALAYTGLGITALIAMFTAALMGIDE